MSALNFFIIILTVCAVRVIAENDIMQEFLTDMDDENVSVLFFSFYIKDYIFLAPVKP